MYIYPLGMFARKMYEVFDGHEVFELLFMLLMLQQEPLQTPIKSTVNKNSSIALTRVEVAQVRARHE